MSNKLKLVLGGLILIALIFGFLHHFFPDVKNYNFDRLHIFFFNLCSGGTIIIYYTEKRQKLSKTGILFFSLAILYSIIIFFNIYYIAIFLGLILSIIIEKVRIKRFSFFPIDFFKSNSEVSEKFNQASLLCLSTGLIICSIVIWNNQYLKLFYFPKLKLETFFLGFSFPISLITLSVMFSFMDKKFQLIKNICFWSINLGVIIFFAFIIANKLALELIIALILLSAITTTFYIFINFCPESQQKKILISGISFLVFTAFTGIFYIVLEFLPQYQAYNYVSKFFLKLHSFASLYGWNLSGLIVICLYNEFPISINIRYFIFFHWITVSFIAPIGYFIKSFAIFLAIAIVTFLFFCFGTIS
ncbi:MAG: hypothetical protein HQK79_12350 [Desulfobacterales bacterium]|nr:hypothetical protein [Desulfobacterales bacterium]